MGKAMQMTTHIVGLIEGDEKFKQMVKIRDLCEEKDMPFPPEVEKFFKNFQELYGEEVMPDGSVLIAEGLEFKATEWSDAYREGIDIKVSDIPANVKVVRFYNWW